MRLSLLFTVLFNLFCFSQHTVNARADLPWSGYVNVFDTGGNYQFGSAWAVAALKTTLNTSNNTITLQPNFNTYNAADPYWSNGAVGNKIIEANTLVEPGATYNGQTLTFTGTVVSNTLDAAYQRKVFIKALNPSNGYADVANVSMDIPASGDFTLTATAAQLPAGTIVQYGFMIKGLNANPTQEAALGSIVITSNASLSTQNFVKNAELSYYPNPVKDMLNIASRTKVTSVSIADSAGNILKNQTVNSRNAQIAVQNLPKGFYMLIVSYEDGTKSAHKILK